MAASIIPPACPGARFFCGRRRLRRLPALAWPALSSPTDWPRALNNLFVRCVFATTVPQRPKPRPCTPADARDTGFPQASGGSTGGTFRPPPKAGPDEGRLPRQSKENACLDLLSTARSPYAPSIAGRWGIRLPPVGGYGGGIGLPAPPCLLAPDGV